MSIDMTFHVASGSYALVAKVPSKEDLCIADFNTATPRTAERQWVFYCDDIAVDPQGICGITRHDKSNPLSHLAREGWFAFYRSGTVVFIRQQAVIYK